MRRKPITVILAVFLVTTVVGQGRSSDLDVNHALVPEALVDTAIQIRERALQDNLPVDLVESITTEVGARRVGTEGDRRAIAWAVAKFRAVVVHAGEIVVIAEFFHPAITASFVGRL